MGQSFMKQNLTVKVERSLDSVPELGRNILRISRNVTRDRFVVPRGEQGPLVVGDLNRTDRDRGKMCAVSVQARPASHMGRCGNLHTYCMEYGVHFTEKKELGKVRSRGGDCCAVGRSDRLI